jgi:hypothetical protein
MTLLPANLLELCASEVGLFEIAFFESGVAIDAVINWVLREISLRREHANVLIDGGKSVAHKSVKAVNVFDEIQRLHEATVK